MSNSKKGKWLKVILISLLCDIVIVAGALWAINAFNNKDNEQDTKIEQVDKGMTTLEAQVKEIKKDLAFLGDKVEVSINELGKGIDIQIKESLKKSEFMVVLENISIIDSSMAECEIALGTEINGFKFNYDRTNGVWKTRLDYLPMTEYEIVDYSVIPETLLGKPIDNKCQYGFFCGCTSPRLKIDKLILADGWYIDDEYVFNENDLSISTIELSESVRDNESTQQFINNQPNIDFIFRPVSSIVK